MCTISEKVQPPKGEAASLACSPKKKKKKVHYLANNNETKRNGTFLPKLSDQVIKHKELLDLLQVGRERRNCKHPVS